MPETRWDSAPSQYQRWPARLVRSTTIFLNRQMMHRLPNVFLIKQNRQSIVCSGRWCIVCWFIFRSLKRWPKSCVFTWKHKIRKKVFLTLILFFSVKKRKKKGLKTIVLKFGQPRGLNRDPTDLELEQGRVEKKIGEVKTRCDSTGWPGQKLVTTR